MQRNYGRNSNGEQISEIKSRSEIEESVIPIQQGTQNQYIQHPPSSTKYCGESFSPHRNMKIQIIKKIKIKPHRNITIQREKKRIPVPTPNVQTSH
jgi:hypothetical protein